MEDNGYGFHKDSGEAVTEREAKEMFDEMLDVCYDKIRFGDVSYFPSDVFGSTDPIAYRIGVNDYIDSLCQDGDRIVSAYEDTDVYMEDDEDDD